MRVAAILLDVILVAATVSIIVTEGVGTDTQTVLLTCLVLLVPLLSAVVIGFQPVVGGDEGRSSGTFATVSANVVLFAVCAWLSVVRYPYPEGNGIIPFVLLCVVAPLLSVLTLMKRPAQAWTRSRRSGA